MGGELTYRTQPQLVPTSSVGNSEVLEFAAAKMQGWRIRMEDCFIVFPCFGEDPSAALFGIFDGHGGMEVAEFVRTHFAEKLLSSKEYADENYPQALKDTFFEMDEMLDSDASSDAGREEIGEISSKLFNECGSYPKTSKALCDFDDGPDFIGCTACVCLIKQGVLYVANAGDSRAVLSVKGECVPLSVDHKPNNPTERRRIIAAGGNVVFGRINNGPNLSRALGDLKYKRNPRLAPQFQLLSPEPDIRLIKLDPSIDFLVLGSDGLFEAMHSREIVEEITLQLKKQNKSLLQIVTSLLPSLVAPKCSYTAGGTRDNLSCILVRLEN